VRDVFMWYMYNPKCVGGIAGTSRITAADRSTKERAYWIASICVASRHSFVDTYTTTRCWRFSKPRVQVEHFYYRRRLSISMDRASYGYISGARDCHLIIWKRGIHVVF
jgi:hypothetical protein